MWLACRLLGIKIRFVFECYRCQNNVFGIKTQNYLLYHSHEKCYTKSARVDVALYNERFLSCVCCIIACVTFSRYITIYFYTIYTPYSLLAQV